MKEGLRRIVRAVSVVAWLCLAGALATGLVILVSDGPGGGLIIAGFGVAAFAVLQGAAWILAGFSGNAKDSDGLIRWPDVWAWRARRGGGSLSGVVDPGPVGVGGWLWLLILGLAIFGPLLAVGQTLQNIEATEKLYPNLVSVPAWVSYKSASWAVIAASCAISIAAGLRLWRGRDPSCVALAMCALWIRGPVTILADSLVTQSFLDFGVGEYFSDPKTIGTLIGATLTAAVWSLYLRNSRRVRNTYHNRLYPPADSMAVPASSGRKDPTL